MHILGNRLTVKKKKKKPIMTMHDLYHICFESESITIIQIILHVYTNHPKTA